MSDMSFLGALAHTTEPDRMDERVQTALVSVSLTIAELNNVVPSVAGALFSVRWRRGRTQTGQTHAAPCGPDQRVALNEKFEFETVVPKGDVTDPKHKKYLEFVILQNDAPIGKVKIEVSYKTESKRRAEVHVVREDGVAQKMLFALALQIKEVKKLRDGTSAAALSAFQPSARREAGVAPAAAARDVPSAPPPRMNTTPMAPPRGQVHTREAPTNQQLQLQQESPFGWVQQPEQIQRTQTPQQPTRQSRGGAATSAIQPTSGKGHRNGASNAYPDEEVRGEFEPSFISAPHVSGHPPPHPRHTIPVSARKPNNALPPELEQASPETRAAIAPLYHMLQEQEEYTDQRTRELHAVRATYANLANDYEHVRCELDEYEFRVQALREDLERERVNNEQLQGLRKEIEAIHMMKAQQQRDCYVSCAVM
jgi:hypothetical protein